MRCFNCQNQATIFWAGHGDTCDDCFYELYSVPLLESFTEEERKRAEKITRNLYEKNSNPQNL